MNSSTTFKYDDIILRSMVLDSTFVDQLMQPEDSLHHLYQKAKINVKQELFRANGNSPREDSDQLADAIEWIAFSYHYNWEQDGKPDNMLILQDPGRFQLHNPTHSRHQETLNKITKDPPSKPLGYIKEHRQITQKWLHGPVSDFTESFLSGCKYSGIIPNKAYMRRGELDADGFFQSFYYTNTIKYRDDCHDSTHREEAFTTQLKQEIEEINPDTIFLSGGDAWETFRNTSKVQIEPVNDDWSGGITEDHCIPGKMTAPITANLLPVNHPSYHSIDWTDQADKIAAGLSEF